MWQGQSEASQEVGPWTLKNLIDNVGKWINPFSQHFILQSTSTFRNALNPSPVSNQKSGQDTISEASCQGGSCRYLVHLSFFLQCLGPIKTVARTQQGISLGCEKTSPATTGAFSRLITLSQYSVENFLIINYNVISVSSSCLRNLCDAPH